VRPHGRVQKSSVCRSVVNEVKKNGNQRKKIAVGIGGRSKEQEEKLQASSVARGDCYVKQFEGTGRAERSYFGEGGKETCMGEDKSRGGRFWYFLV